MSFVSNILFKLTKKLLPTGRVFRMPESGVFKKLNDAMILSEERVVNDVLSIYDSIFPDNDNFNQDDATAWERALGLIINPTSTLDDRKLAIRRKLNHPGTIKARQNYRYIERELRAAGFDVFVYENRFDDGNGGYITKTPGEVAVSSISQKIQHGNISHGTAQHGQAFVYKIANSIDPVIDSRFDTGDNLKSTFYISSSTLGVNAIIPESREAEFRKLVLTLKPVQTVAFSFVSIVPDIIEYVLTQDGGRILTQDGGNLLKQNSFS